MYQKVQLIGRLGQKDVRSTPTGTQVVSYSVATSKSIKDKESQQWKETTEWHRCVSFGKAAEHIAMNIEPGDLLLIEGEMKTRQWRSQNGEDRFTTEIMVNDFPKKLPKYFKRDAQGAQNGLAVPSGQTSQESPPIDNYDWDDIPL